MAATYNQNLSTYKDKIRFAVGDTNLSDIYLQDEEILALISEAGIIEAGALAAEAIAAKFARFVDQTTGKIRVNYSQIFDHYIALAKRIRATGILGIGSGAENSFAGGISMSENRISESDSDRNPSVFDIGMHDNKGSEGNANETVS